MSDELTPITRKETFLAKAGGQNVVTPTPITREETFLQAIIDNGGGGGGTGGGMVVTISGGETLTMDKTFGEIMTAVTTVPVSFIYSYPQGSGVVVEPATLLSIADVSVTKEILLMLQGDTLGFTAVTDDDYPTYTE